MSEPAGLAEKIVVKIGGELLVTGEMRSLARDLRKLVETGARVCIVHGGGVQANALQEKLGIPTQKVAGRRITDEATLDVMKMTLAGKVNVDICAELVAAGTRPVGLHGASALTIHAVKRPPKVMAGAGAEPVDFGHVGDVVGANTALIEHLWLGGYLPVIASLGCGTDGAVYNINADTVANQIAAALGATRLFLVTSVPGVLRDVADPSTRLPRLSRAEAVQAIKDGVITGGMIPKVEEAMAVIAEGVGAIHILGKLSDGDLFREARDPGSVGTALIP